MNRLLSHWACRLSAALLLVPGAFSAQQQVGQWPDPPLSSISLANPPTGGLCTARTTGFWDVPSTWNCGHVPYDHSVVVIPDGVQVTIRSELPNRHIYVGVHGDLRFVIQQNTQLRAESILIGETGTLKIGNPMNRVFAGVTAKILIAPGAGPIDLNYDPMQVSRGIVNFGEIAIYGAIKEPWGVLVDPVLPTSTLVKVDKRDGQGPIVDWVDGDEVVVAGTRFRERRELEDELFTISGWATGQFNIGSPAPAFRHEGVNAQTPVHVANLTRSVEIRSEDSQPIGRRGHFMSPSSEVVLEYVAFKDFGRTDKRIPLDDRDVVIHSTMDDDYTETQPLPEDIDNRRGRYAVHFHRNMTEPEAEIAPTQVKGCVAWGTPGWGFVNHTSHVDFTDNVAYDFAGAGFVTEAGDEMGSFVGNLAIRGTGVRVDSQGEPTTDHADTKYFPTRFVFENPLRPQPLSDFGWAGDGFWFQGPMLTVTDNVASTCSGSGMIWFTTGAADFYPGDSYVGVLYEDAEDAYDAVPGGAQIPNENEIRKWLGGDQVILVDLPILKMEGFQGYACHSGFRMRFNNATANSFYSEGPFSHDRFYDIPGPLVRSQQEIQGLTLWNNQFGFKTRYSSETKLKDICIFNGMEGRTDTISRIGAQIHHAIDSYEVENLEVEGYALAGLQFDVDTTPMSEKTSNGDVTFTPIPNYVNCAIRDSRDAYPGMPPAIDSGTVAFAPGTNTLSWNSVPVTPHTSCPSGFYDEPATSLVRYRPVAPVDQHFAFATAPRPPVGTTTLNVDLPGLMPGTTYEFQIIQDFTAYYTDGVTDPCPSPMPRWSDPVEFTTN